MCFSLNECAKATFTNTFTANSLHHLRSRSKDQRAAKKMFTKYLRTNDAKEFITHKPKRKLESCTTEDCNYYSRRNRSLKTEKLQSETFPILLLSKALTSETARY